MMISFTAKQRKACLSAAVTAAVYLSFRFLLPLVLPFLLSYLIALFLRPSAVWLERRLRVSCFGKKYALPIGIIGAVQLFLLIIVLSIVFYFGGLCFFREAKELAEKIPEGLRMLDEKLTQLCRMTEEFCHLEPDSLVLQMRGLLKETAVNVKGALMPDLFFHSISVFALTLKAAVFLVVFVIAVILSLQEMDELRSRRSRSLFHREFFLLGRRLCLTGSAWLRTQLVILSGTICFCIFALFLMGNSYAILAGVGIGLLDALPIFGVGTVLLPWSAVLCLKHQWKRAAGILILDLICYFFREFMEAKLMGKKVGLSALETLISIYVGLKLFGALGFLLGPIGLLMIRDFVEEYDPERKNRV